MDSGDVNLIFFEVSFIIFQITAVVLNGAILCTLWKKSLFKCPSNKLVFSLCMAQLIVSVLSFLISVTQSFVTSPVRVLSSPSSKSVSLEYPKENTVNRASDGETVITSNGDATPALEEISENYGAMNYILPHIQLYAYFVVAIGATITTGLISIDRYITISEPMKYKSIVTPGRCALAISICWLVSALITILPPLFIFGNETFLHGPIAVPRDGLGLYFAVILSVVTLLVLSVMIVCYSRIFKIAKKKCQKVQIGHFTSPVSSISSGWPSSCYSSHNDGQETLALAPVFESDTPSPVRNTRAPPRVMSNSSLPHVFLVNFGKQVSSEPEIRKPFTLNLNSLRNSSSESRNGLRGLIPVVVPSNFKSESKVLHRSRTPLGLKSTGALLKQSTRTGIRKCRTFLRQSYNSPRKTVSTIGALIGSLALTQLPLTLVLYTTNFFPSVFYFTIKILLSLSAISSPILYGFLNRTIRVYLWKFLRIRQGFERPKQFCYMDSKAFDSRKASISSNTSQFYRGRRDSNQLMEPQAELWGPLNENPEIILETWAEAEKNSIQNVRGSDGTYSENELEKISDSIQNQSHDRKCDEPKEFLAEHVEVHTKDDPGQDKNVDENDINGNSELSSSFPRKPSQDSGADVSFSEDEEDGMESGRREPVETSDSTMRARGSPRSTTLPEYKEDPDGNERMRVILAVSMGEGCHYMDEGESNDDLSEPDDLYDFDQDDEEIESMKEMIKKKFSLTEDDMKSIRDLDLFYGETIIEIGKPIEV